MEEDLLRSGEEERIEEDGNGAMKINFAGAGCEFSD